MNIDFNNVRKQAVYAYEDLVEKLNGAIIKNDKQWALPNGIYHGQDVNLKGYVLIDAEDLQSTVDELRSLIGSIAMTYKPKDKSFKNMFEEIYPEENKSMPCFNEESERVIY